MWSVDWLGMEGLTRPWPQGHANNDDDNDDNDDHDDDDDDDDDTDDYR